MSIYITEIYKIKNRFSNKMKNLDLLTKRTIALYLNAFDKIGRLALVSK